MAHLIHDCNLTPGPRLSVRTYTPAHNLCTYQLQICIGMTGCDTTDLLVVLTTSSRAPAVTTRSRHGIELRPHAAEEIVTLLLGHAPYGLVWSHTSLIIPCRTDSLAANSNGDARTGRASIIIDESDSGVWSMVRDGVVPAFLSRLDTGITMD